MRFKLFYLKQNLTYRRELQTVTGGIEKTNTRLVSREHIQDE